jgi:hypothetical protein
MGSEVFCLSLSIKETGLGTRAGGLQGMARPPAPYGIYGRSRPKI